MEPFLPVVDDAVFELRPDFRLLSLSASGVGWHSDRRPELARYVEEAERSATLDDPGRAAHLAAWEGAYRAFGAKPKRTPCSAAALLRRVRRDGSLPRINAVVDAYNAVSVRHGLPIGGENRDAYQGRPRLLRAVGSERFDTVRNGEAAVELPTPGEVVWCDQIGVTCRRWNWRQGRRTRVAEGTPNVWFVLEVLDPMPAGQAHRAVDDLAALLRSFDASTRLDVHEISREGVVDRSR